MRKIITICAAILLAAGVFAQAPQKMSYQAVIRNSSNDLVTNTKVGMRISILQGSTSGTAVYVETQAPTSNANGLVSIEIGAGNVVSGSFKAINWANGPYFIKTETDPTGGTNYTINGTSQFLSVPYALHAKTAETVTRDSTNDFFLGQDTLGGIVFYIYFDQNGKQHGLIVSKTETTAKWQSTSSTTNATRSWDGAYNMNLMTNSPAKTWVTSLGSGWYLPSIDELSILWHNRFHANEGLNDANATLLSTTAYYWSSVESGTTYAFYLYFLSGTAASSGSKSFDNFNVRAVRAF